MESIKMLKTRGNIHVLEEIDGERVELKSTIIGVDYENNRFLMYNPIYKNRIYTLSKDKTFVFRYIDNKSGIYSFNGKILNRIKEKGLYILKVELLGNLKKIQRREFFRIDLIKNVIIKEPLEEKYKESLEMIELIGKIEFSEKKYLLKDISGGGFGFYSNDKFAIGKIIVAKINLGMGDIEIMGKVVRTISIDIENKKYLIGVQHLQLTTNKRNLIVNFIFERQRQMRQKGLI
ncbi:PilZ domain-containing protein [Clostridiaceae bacterium HSG29]|nr:PilZ domain-containing protein [Clostridiaceae bacterium HSG29]